MHRIIKIGFQLVIANAVIALCIGIAARLPGLWTGSGGRDVIPQALTAAILILVVSTFIRIKLKWRNLNMILYLIPLQMLVLIGMSYFSGYSVLRIVFSFDLLLDFFQWLLLVDLFIAMPWVVGVFTGSFWLKHL